MKDINGKIQYREKEYTLVFNLNVMESIQQEYGTIDKWAELTDGKSGEPDARAVIFGIKEMINEGIDIENDEHGTDIKPLTHKQVGRIITEAGLMESTRILNETVIESTRDVEKNG